jgi:hypothetical protein
MTNKTETEQEAKAVTINKLVLELDKVRENCRGR